MKQIWISSALAVAVVAGACRSSSSRADSAHVPDISAPTDSQVEAQLEMLDPKIVAQGTGRALEFGLRNASGHGVEFLFTVDWFDATGNPVPLSPRGWNRLAIESHVTQSVRVEPMPQEAHSWRLRFSSTGNR